MWPLQHKKTKKQATRLSQVDIDDRFYYKVSVSSCYSSVQYVAQHTRYLNLWNKTLSAFIHDFSGN